MSLVFALSALAIAVGAVDTRGQAVKLRDSSPAADHPIFDPYVSLQQPGQVRIGRTHDQVVYATPVRYEFRLALPKRRYAIGEPVWATLTVRNNSDKLAIRLSRPFVGQLVATCGVWRARWDWLGGGQFTGPLEVVPLNKGCSPGGHGAACFGGPPVLLKPDETYTATVPLNVAQQVHPGLWDRRGPRLAWFSGVGLTEPGLFRLYVQYANLEKLVPFGTDPPDHQVLQKAKALKPGDPVDLPFEAIVPEPVEIEIALPRMKAWDATRAAADLDRYLRLLRQWEAAALDTKGDSVGVPSFDDLPAVLDSIDPSEAAVRQSLVLTRLRFDFSGRDPKARSYAAELEDVLRALGDARKEVEAGPLADAYDLTLCHVYRALGREADAASLARKLGTPDAAAFLSGR